MARLRRALTWLQLAVLGQGGGGQKDGADGRPHCYPRSESGPAIGLNLPRHRRFSA